MALNPEKIQEWAADESIPLLSPALAETAARLLRAFGLDI